MHLLKLSEYSRIYHVGFADVHGICEGAQTSAYFFTVIAPNLGMDLIDDTNPICTQTAGPIDVACCVAKVGFESNAASASGLFSLVINVRAIAPILMPSSSVHSPSISWSTCARIFIRVDLPAVPAPTHKLRFRV